MARISRVVAPGYPHHATQRGARPISTFQTDSDRMVYLDFMGDALNRCGIEVLAWCLMTNQSHDESSIQTTLLRGIRTGRPAGSGQFIEMMERFTGRDLMTRKAGRPVRRTS